MRRNQWFLAMGISSTQETAKTAGGIVCVCVCDTLSCPLRLCGANVCQLMCAAVT